MLLPSTAFPRRVSAENRIPGEVLQELERRGHEVHVADGWVHGKVMGIRLDQETGVISGGVAPKGDVGYAMGW